jgi:hypothetical protein
VLGFVAQTLVYSASIYGVSIYIQGKFGEMRTYLKEYLTNNEAANSNNKEELQAAA